MGTGEVVVLCTACVALLRESFSEASEGPLHDSLASP